MATINTACTIDHTGTPGINLSCSVNDVIQRSPDTLPVFAAYGLDTCCRGAMSVHDAACDAGVEPAVLEHALRATLLANAPDIAPRQRDN